MQPTENDWRESPYFQPRQQQFFNRIVLAIILVGTSIWIGNVLFGKDGLINDGYLTNLYTDMISIGVTVGIIELFNQRRAETQLQKQLLREIGNPDNGMAIRALEELKALGALEDGTLKGKRFGPLNLKNADLSRADLRETWLLAADLESAKCMGINLESAFVFQSNMKRSILLNANLQKALLNQVDLEGAVLWGADFCNSDLTGTNLTHAQLEGYKSPNGNLSTNPQENSKVIKALFNENTILPDKTYWTPQIDMEKFTNPNRIDFWRGYKLLHQRDLRRVSLRYANLLNASLFEHDLREADLTQADLRGTNLQKANLQKANLSGARFDENTILPDGIYWTPEIDMTKYLL